MNERDVERYLVKRVKELVGEVRKVKWIGRAGAPDRLVMLPACGVLHRPSFRPSASWWVEVKAPGKGATKAQQREHQRMRDYGVCVMVASSLKGVDAMLDSLLL